MKRKTIRYTVLRNKVGHYLSWWEKGLGADVEWGISTTPWSAKNFYSNPNELSTALKYFKSRLGWTVVEGTLTWREN